MRIPYYIDEVIKQNEIKIDSNILSFLKLHKKDSDEILSKIKDIYQYYIKDTFICEYNYPSSYIRKIILLSSSMRDKVFLVDNQDRFYYVNFNRRLSSYNKEDIFDEVLNFINQNAQKYQVPVYLYNDTIKREVTSSFIILSRDILSKFKNTYMPLYFKYSKLYKSNTAFFIKIIQNKFFAFVDKELYKELYSYYKHDSSTYLYDHLLKEKRADSDIYHNFMRFKSEHNFLSMTYRGVNEEKFLKVFENYDTILENTRLTLKCTKEFINLTKGKNYNDFLYFKTPQKLLNISKKLHVELKSEFGLEQYKLLNSVFLKKNTYITKDILQDALSSPEKSRYLNTLINVRKNLDLKATTSLFDEEEETYNFEIKSLKVIEEETKAKFFEMIAAQIKVEDSNRLEIFKKDNLKLEQIDGKEVLESIYTYIFEGKKKYSNLQYYAELISNINKLKRGVVFSLKENRQKHIVIVDLYNFDVIIDDETLTKRCFSIVKTLISSDEFKRYYIDNLYNIQKNLSE